jgi:chromosome transmission fidelity protein 4
VSSLQGRPVAVAAQSSLLAAVWHAGMPTAEGDQCLAYSLACTATHAALHSGALPLSAGASLTWLGFSDEGLLAAYDSKVGCCRS